MAWDCWVQSGGQSSLDLSFPRQHHECHRVAWPSGLRRWFKAPVSSEAWVRIPPLPESFLKIEKKNAFVHLTKLMVDTNMAQWSRGMIPALGAGGPGFKSRLSPSVLFDWVASKSKAKTQGAPGFEPGTSRSAVECSTTELYPRGRWKGSFQKAWLNRGWCSKKFCQMWDSNPRPHQRTRILMTALYRRAR